ncbi:MAG: thiamine pyrophosphate-requiring protein [Hyphomicrobiales bacterium]|nr:thiamine pyrophosphate-requiring protein [Hyphomicrobiales bacterium]
MEAIFLNPGTDTPPLQEAWAKLSMAGETVPRLVLCPHEIVAVTAAQGYYLASGKPQVAFVHVDVGTANAAGGLNDARASQIPLLLCAGTSPSVLDSQVPGARTKFINWLQDVPDQPALVRNYTKWASVLNHPEAIGATVERAFQIAQSEPCGPVYLAMARELMMAEVETTYARGPERTRPSILQGLTDATADRVVAALAEAQFPLLLTGYAGRSREHREALVKLADTLAIGITEYRGRFNAPLEHPLHLGFNPERWVGQADVVLVVDQDVPFVPADRELRPDARFIHMGTNPIQTGMTQWGFPADEVLPVNVKEGLDALLRAAERYLPSLDEKRHGGRRQEMENRHRQVIEPFENTPRIANVITPFMVGQTLTELCPEAQLYEEAVTSGNPFAYGFRPSSEGAYMRNGGSFLGWGLGASIGAALARPDKLVVTVVGDGSFMFGVPSAALWTAVQNRVAVLILVVNNACYNSVRLAARDAYPSGTQAASGFVGVDIIDPPAFEAIAQACGAWGVRVDNPVELKPRIREALDVVKGGRTAVVNITIQAAEKPL